MSVTDSKNVYSCKAEPILKVLSDIAKDKHIFSYPEKNAKKKKIVRKEIKVARIDLNNNELITYLSSFGRVISESILIVHNGEIYVYDGTWHEVIVLMHHMQRIVNPLITLSSESDILSFMDTSKDTIYEGDYVGGLLAKTYRFDHHREMNEYLWEMSY